MFKKTLLESPSPKDVLHNLIWPIDSGEDVNEQAIKKTHLRFQIRLARNEMVYIIPSTFTTQLKSWK